MATILIIMMKRMNYTFAGKLMVLKKIYLYLSKKKFLKILSKNLHILQKIDFFRCKYQDMATDGKGVPVIFCKPTRETIELNFDYFTRVVEDLQFELSQIKARREHGSKQESDAEKARVAKMQVIRDNHFEKGRIVKLLKKIFENLKICLEKRQINITYDEKHLTI